MPDNQRSFRNVVNPEDLSQYFCGVWSSKLAATQTGRVSALIRRSSLFFPEPQKTDDCAWHWESGRKCNFRFLGQVPLAAIDGGLCADYILDNTFSEACGLLLDSFGLAIIIRTNHPCSGSLFSLQFCGINSSKL